MPVQTKLLPEVNEVIRSLLATSKELVPLLFSNWAKLFIVMNVMSPALTSVANEFYSWDCMGEFVKDREYGT